jgi:hypothetical protein
MAPPAIIRVRLRLLWGLGTSSVFSAIDLLRLFRCLRYRTGAQQLE